MMETYPHINKEEFIEPSLDPLEPVYEDGDYNLFYQALKHCRGGGSISPFKPKFYHRITANDKRRLIIPKDYRTNLEGINYNHCAPCLVDNEGKTWKITVVNFEITEGWEAFYDFYKLKIGDIIGLTHNGCLSFHIMVFDGTTECFKSYPNNGEAEQEEIDVDETYAVNFTQSAKDVGKMYVPRRFKRLYDLKFAQNFSVSLIDPHSVEWGMRLRHYKGGTEIWMYGDWDGVSKANDYWVGQTLKLRVQAKRGVAGIFFYLNN